jgi:hypothetical protein
MNNSPSSARLGPVKHTVDLSHGIAAKRAHITTGQNRIVQAALTQFSQ